MRKPEAPVSYGIFPLRRFGEKDVGVLFPRPLALRMGLRAGAKVTFEVKDGRVHVRIAGVRTLSRGEFYRASAGWPALRQALRRRAGRR